jgi:cytochrome P450
MTSTEELVGHFDLFNIEHVDRKWELLGYGRQRCPVIHTDADEGYYIVTRYEDVRAVAEDPVTFSSEEPGLRGVPIRMPPLTEDPPRHNQFRRFLNKYFSRSYLLRYEDVMRAAANEIIDTFIDAGRLEFIHDFGIPFTAACLARVILDDDNQERISAAVVVATRIGSEGTPEAFFDMTEHARRCLEDRAASGSQRDDVLAAIVSATVDGRPLTAEEQVGIVTVLFSGGLDTTKGAIGNIAHNLATVPGLEQRLRDPGWVRSDLDEFLRYESPVMFQARTVTRDTVLNGCQLKAGDRLAIHFASANRDEAKFEHPDELRFDRARNPHAAFGLGIHRCIGAQFARLQIEVVFGEMLKRLTNLRIPAGEHAVMAPGVALTFELLPLEFQRLSGLPQAKSSLRSGEHR